MCWVQRMNQNSGPKPQDRLEPCRACGHKCYRWADPCPNCGVDWPTHIAWVTSWLVLAGGVFALCVVAAAIFG